MDNKDSHGVNGEKWVGFDLDGTLAKYDGWKGIDHIGDPIKPMCDLIKKLHAEGKCVKILTARVAPRKDGDNIKEAGNCIEKWCEKNLGFVPEITHEKDSCMEELYDDRAIQVIPNKGVPIVEAAQSIADGKRDNAAKALIEFLEQE